jgi:hypothetical protein
MKSYMGVIVLDVSGTLLHSRQKTCMQLYTLFQKNMLKLYWNIDIQTKKYIFPYWQGSWYKKLHDTSIAILALPCNRAFTELQKKTMIYMTLEVLVIGAGRWCRFAFNCMQFVYKLFPPKWRILTMKTLSYKLRRLSICSFDQITSLLFSPFQSCFIYHVLTMCLNLLMML